MRRLLQDPVAPQLRSKLRALVWKKSYIEISLNESTNSKDKHDSQILQLRRVAGAWFVVFVVSCNGWARVGLGEMT